MIRINLLKPEKKELKETPTITTPEIKKERKVPVYSLIFLLLIVIIAFLFISQRNAIHKEKNLLKKAQAEKAQLKDVLVKLDQLEKQRAIIQRKINLIKQLKARQEVAVIIMDELSKNIPDWVWLTEVNYKEHTIEIKGRALSNNLIADYIFNLENSPYLFNVNLLSSAQKRVQNNQFLEFVLTAQYILKGTTAPQPTQPKNEGEK